MGLYLGNKKVSPAIIEKENVFKLHKPIVYIDYDADRLYYYKIPCDYLYTNKTELYNGDEKIQTLTEKYTTSSGDKIYYNTNNNADEIPSLDLSTFSSGRYDLKLKSIESKADSSTIQNLGIYLSVGGFVKGRLSTSTYENDKILDSDYSEILHYERYNYINNLTALNLNGSLSGMLNNTKYDEGKLIDYNKSIFYNFNLNPSNKGVSNTNSSFVIFNATKSEDSLICPGHYYGSSFAKVSFTLDTDTEVKVKYQITKSSSTTPTILICPIDKNYTSFSYSTKLSSPVVSFNTTTDFEEKEYSFGTLSAGEHFYFVEFYGYGSDFRNSWKATITPVFEKIPIGKYLPADITVENSNYPEPEYEYDPYTGEFKIPMTGNITMTAIGIDNPLLDKLSITPATWNVSTSTLTWNYSIDGATYYIQTPNGQEYTTTEKSFDFTGKLGDAGYFRRVKIWASKGNNISGKAAIKLLYSPNYDVIKFNDFEILNTYGKTNADFKIVGKTDNSLYYIRTVTCTYGKINLETYAKTDLGTYPTFSHSTGYCVENNYIYLFGDDKYHIINMNDGSITETTITSDTDNITGIKNPIKINNKIYFLGYVGNSYRFFVLDLEANTITYKNQLSNNKANIFIKYNNYIIFDGYYLSNYFHFIFYNIDTDTADDIKVPISNTDGIYSYYTYIENNILYSFGNKKIFEINLTSKTLEIKDATITFASSPITCKLNDEKTIAFTYGDRDIYYYLIDKTIMVKKDECKIYSEYSGSSSRPLYEYSNCVECGGKIYLFAYGYYDAERPLKLYAAPLGGK